MRRWRLGRRDGVVDFGDGFVAHARKGFERAVGDSGTEFFERIDAEGLPHGPRGFGAHAWQLHDGEEAMGNLAGEFAMFGDGACGDELDDFVGGLWADAVDGEELLARELID
jgi:hypothetical protein